jgi:hypothetical protein
MAYDEKMLHRCEPDDPDRCQAGAPPEGQCYNLSVHGMFKRDLFPADHPGKEYAENIDLCPKHMGTKQMAVKQKTEVHDLRLQHWQIRVNQLAESENVKTLRGEIGVLRLVLESVLNNCETATDLVVFSTKISDLVVKLERLVTSCNRTEISMGAVLDKTAVLQFGGRVVEIISGYIDDPKILDKISDGIIDALGEVTDCTS